jgi:phosphoglycerate dehydrogenase-like enzyme
MYKIIITDYVTNPDIEKNIFGDNVQIICLNEEDESKYSNEIESADGIMVWHGKISSVTLKKLKKCKIIVKYGTGYDNVDHKACKEYGIPFCNTPDYGVEEVADTACALMLNFIRQITLYNTNAKYIIDGWQLHSNMPIKRTSDHKLGIIGIGRMGTAVSSRMKAFAIDVAFYDPHVPSGYEKAIGVKRFNNLNELIKFSSIITIHTPLTDETNGIIDEEFIHNLNDGTILVNTARGKLIKNLDLIYEGLLKGKLSFVGLDVLPDEPPSNNEKLIQAWKDPNHKLFNRIIINPHSAYYSQKAWFEMRSKSADNILNVLLGGRPRNLIS